MTGSRVDRGPHIDDGDLIRLLDGECSAEEAEQLRAHIETCPECKGNTDSLKLASAQFSGLLAELDTEAPLTETPRFRFVSSRILRAAAVLAVMVLVFAATPARAWLVQGWEVLKSLVTAQTADPPAETTLPEIAGPETSSVIRFAPRGSSFRLEFTERPAGGKLVLLFDSGTTASAGVAGGDGTDEMIVLSDGLRIRNSANSIASYEIRLPLTLSAVEVFIGGGSELRLDVSSLEAPFRRELELSGEGR